MSTYNIPFPNMKKIILNYPKSAAMGFVKRAISVRAIEVLLYFMRTIVCTLSHFTHTLLSTFVIV